MKITNYEDIETIKEILKKYSDMQVDLSPDDVDYLCDRINDYVEMQKTVKELKAYAINHADIPVITIDSIPALSSPPITESDLDRRKTYPKLVPTKLRTATSKEDTKEKKTMKKNDKRKGNTKKAVKLVMKSNANLIKICDGSKKHKFISKLEREVSTVYRMRSKHETIIMFNIVNQLLYGNNDDNTAIFSMRDTECLSLVESYIKRKLRTSTKPVKIILVIETIFTPINMDVVDTGSSIIFTDEFTGVLEHPGNSIISSSIVTEKRFDTDDFRFKMNLSKKVNDKPCYCKIQEDINDIKPKFVLENERDLFSVSPNIKVLVLDNNSNRIEKFINTSNLYHYLVIQNMNDFQGLLNFFTNGPVFKKTVIRIDSDYFNKNELNVFYNTLANTNDESKFIIISKFKLDMPGRHLSEDAAKCLYTKGKLYSLMED